MALEHDDVALSLENIQAYYGESHVLHGVSFSLRRSRVLALLGRNGAGKTTSMNVAIGWLSPREDRKSTRLNSSHMSESRMPSSA